MYNMAVTLQRVQNIEQRIGFPSPENGFSDHLARALESPGEATLLSESPVVAPTLMTIGNWLGLSDTAPAVGLVVPITGEWGSGFGTRIDPFTGETRMHQGIDVSAPEGTPIRAVSEGVVSFAGSRGGFGNLVVIDHANGLQSYYAHQSVIGVAVGDQVAAGTEIGAVGSTGRSTGPHLHFELRRDGEPVDPAPYFGGTR